MLADAVKLFSFRAPTTQNMLTFSLRGSTIGQYRKRRLLFIKKIILFGIVMILTKFITLYNILLSDFLLKCLNDV